MVLPYSQSANYLEGAYLSWRKSTLYSDHLYSATLYPLESPLKGQDPAGTVHEEGGEGEQQRGCRVRHGRHSGGGGGGREQEELDRQ